MKKNNMLRIASVLLVAVLLSTCAISGAFAKYTTSGTATDTARVAKFGITVNANASKAFANTYADLDGDGKIIPATPAVGDGEGVSVVGQSDAIVVAPGTEGAFSAFTFDGTAEVAVEVKTTATLALVGWEVSGDYYCPIVIYKNGVEVADGSDYTSIEEFQNEVASAAANSTVFAAGATVSSTDVWSWEWAFEVDDNKDTLLGQSNATNTIQLTVTATVTQVD